MELKNNYVGSEQSNYAYRLPTNDHIDMRMLESKKGSDAGIGGHSRKRRNVMTKSLNPHDRPL